MRKLAPPRRRSAAKTALRFALAVFAAVFFAGPGRTADSTPALANPAAGTRYVDLVFDRVERTNNITYGTAIDKPTGRSVDLLLDIYEPAGDTEAKRPVFVFLFGGGFVAGNKDTEPRQYCELMSKRGYVAVSIMYRINQGNVATVGIPAAVSDTRQAVAWLRAHASEHRLDVGRIILGGSSAGSITSLFTAYTEMEKKAGSHDSDVALVMDLWGGLYTSVNEMTTGEPPLIIIHGTADNVVPFSEATKLRDRAELVDIPYAFHPLEGQGHAPYMPVDLMKLVAAFAYDRLWQPSSALTPTALPPTATKVPPTAMPLPTSTSVPPTAAPTEAPPTALPSPEPTEVPRFEIFLPRAETG